MSILNAHNLNFPDSPTCHTITHASFCTEQEQVIIGSMSARHYLSKILVTVVIMINGIMSIKIWRQNRENHAQHKKELTSNNFEYRYSIIRTLCTVGQRNTRPSSY